MRDAHADINIMIQLSTLTPTHAQVATLGDGEDGLPAEAHDARGVRPIIVVCEDRYQTLCSVH